MLKIRENTAHVHNYACTSIHMKKFYNLFYKYIKMASKKELEAQEISLKHPQHDS